MDNKLTINAHHNFDKKLDHDVKFKSSKENLNELKIVSNQFEAIFLNQVLKQARQGKIAEGLFNSEAEETFNTLVDQEYSKILSEKSNFGIAESIFDQFKNHVSAERKK